MKYIEINHPEFSKVNFDYCYICNKSLNLDDQTRDHIIPNKMYPSGSQKRPQLYVHHKCNNDKSMEDERFEKRILLMSNLNSQANALLYRKVINPALGEVHNLNIVGQSKNIRNYKLLRTLTDGISHQLDIVNKGRELSYIKYPEKHGNEMNSYVQRMMRGLYLRNLPTANIEYPELAWIDKHRASIEGKLDTVMQSAGNIIQTAKDANTIFGQSWNNQIEYFGTSTSEDINKGIIMTEFYNSVLIFGIFR